MTQLNSYTTKIFPSSSPNSLSLLRYSLIYVAQCLGSQNISDQITSKPATQGLNRVYRKYQWIRSDRVIEKV